MAKNKRSGRDEAERFLRKVIRGKVGDYVIPKAGANGTEETVAVPAKLSDRMEAAEILLKHCPDKESMNDFGSVAALVEAAAAGLGSGP